MATRAQSNPDTVNPEKLLQSDTMKVVTTAANTFALRFSQKFVERYGMATRSCS